MFASRGSKGPTKRFSLELPVSSISAEKNYGKMGEQPSSSAVFIYGLPMVMESMMGSCPLKWIHRKRTASILLLKDIGRLFCFLWKNKKRS